MRGRLILILLVLVAVIGGGAYLYLTRLEGERPSVALTPEPEYLGKNTTVQLEARDDRSGLRGLNVEIVQGDRIVPVFDKAYPRKTASVVESVSLSPGDLGLDQGQAILRVRATDHSWRRGGNPRLVEQLITVDTRPPNVGVMSRFHYVNQGGAGLVVYRASEPLVKSGVQVGDRWFPGYLTAADEYLCFFAVPYDAPKSTSVVLLSEDPAGNRARTTFNHRIKSKRFRHDTMRISDGFLDKIMPYFQSRNPSLDGDRATVFLRINRDFRKRDAERIASLCEQTEPTLLWSGTFLRMENAKPMARFADHRVYYYEDKEIDRQVHLGVDLASVVMSPVKAANRGKIVFADELGIYGNTVLLDHGCGLFSMYSHLSRIDVAPGQAVEKGEILGLTGSTGLAGGDHLHFSVIVSGTFVNPIEWWDPHWVQDNVETKLVLLQSYGG